MGKKSAERKQPKKLQLRLTNLALEIAKALGRDLDFSIDSIREVDYVLGQVHSDYQETGNEEGLQGIALEFAAYIITVIEKNIDEGTWKRDSEELGKDTFPYETASGNTVFPYAWCMKRIVAGESDNVWIKFSELVLNK